MMTCRVLAKRCRTRRLTVPLLRGLAATAAELRILRKSGATLRARSGDQRTTALLAEACTLGAHDTTDWTGKPGIILRRGWRIVVPVAGITIPATVIAPAMTAPHSLAVVATAVTAKKPF